jgi:hypothetical protein
MTRYFVESVVNFSGYIEADSKEEAEEQGYYYENLTYDSVESVDAELEEDEEDEEEGEE